MMRKLIIYQNNHKVPFKQIQAELVNKKKLTSFIFKYKHTGNIHSRGMVVNNKKDEQNFM